MIAQDLRLALDPALLFEAASMKPDPWQSDVLRKRAKESLLLCTRQAGKSTTTAAVAIHEAIYHAPALILLLSPSLRQSAELFRKVMTFLNALNHAAKPRQESTLRLELLNGSRIISLPGTEATVRGYSGVSLLIVDEASRVEDALYYSIRPMLAVSGGRIMALTTPFGKRGFFFDAWEKGGTSWNRVRVTANDCPRISKDFLAAERAAMGDWWYSQEYLCEFRDSTESVFSYDEVSKAVSSSVTPLFSGQTGTPSPISTTIKPLFTGKEGTI